MLIISFYAEHILNAKQARANAKKGKFVRQKLRAMLVSAFSEHILLLQVVRYCLQKLKFDYFELTLNNLKAIFFAEGLKLEMHFLLSRFLYFWKKENVWKNKLYEPLRNFSKKFNHFCQFYRIDDFPRL